MSGLVGCVSAAGLCTAADGLPDCSGYPGEAVVSVTNHVPGCVPE